MGDSGIRAPNVTVQAAEQRHFRILSQTGGHRSGETLISLRCIPSLYIKHSLMEIIEEPEDEHDDINNVAAAAAAAAGAACAADEPRKCS